MRHIKIPIPDCVFALIIMLGVVLGFATILGVYWGILQLMLAGYALYAFIAWAGVIFIFAYIFIYNSIRSKK